MVSYSYIKAGFLAQTIIEVCIIFKELSIKFNLINNDSYFANGVVMYKAWLFIELHLSIVNALELTL